MSQRSVEEALGAGPGRRIARIPVTTLASGDQLDLVVHVLVGTGPGPRVGVMLGTHGGETFVTELWRVFLQELGTESLAGSLFVMPVANSTAFDSGTRHTPNDMFNLNRVFPGNPLGWYTELLADAIASSFVPNADYLFDYHCPSDKARACRFTYTTSLDTDAGRLVHALAVASGAPLLYDAPAIPGSLGDFCLTQGIPTFIPEVGGSPAVDGQHLEIGLRELRNALRHLGMLQGDAEPVGRQVIVRDVQHVRPHSGGLFSPALTFDDLGVELGDGALLGTVYNATTLERLEDLRAPYRRNVLLSMRVLSRVQPGDYAFSVADLDTAEVISH